jgi:hypothetical protein
MATRKSASVQQLKPDEKTASTAAKPEGRPRLIPSPEVMQAKADEYFADCEIRVKPPTMAGLCYWLGFADRHSISEYEKFKEFTATVKRLRLRIEQDRSENLIAKDKFTPGLIFDLKNNHGWVDKQEVEHSGNIGIMERINRARGRR